MKIPKKANLLLVISILLLVGNTFLIFGFNTFTDIVYSVFFYHVAVAWSTYLAFTVSLIYHVDFLRNNKRKLSIVGKNSVIAGVIFAAITLITGMIWYNATQYRITSNPETTGYYSNIFWDWSDPRMVSTLVLLLTYVAYLIFRSMIEDKEKSARFGALWSIISFPSIPMSYLSAVLFTSTHPLITQGSIYWDPLKFTSLFLNLIAITFFLVFFLMKTTELDKKHYQLENLIQRKLEEE